MTTAPRVPAPRAPVAPAVTDAPSAGVPPDWLVVHVLARWNDSVLLARRADSGLWVLPSGRPAFGEALSVAACRVARTQVGLSVEPEGMLLVHARYRDDVPGRVDLFFSPSRFRGIPVIVDRDSFDDLGWYRPEPSYPGQRGPEQVPPAVNRQLMAVLAPHRPPSSPSARG